MEWIYRTLNKPFFIFSAPRTKNPSWVLVYRLIMLSSFASLLGLIIVSIDPIVLYFNLPSFLRFSYLALYAILITLVAAFAVLVYMYEKKRTREKEKNRERNRWNERERKERRIARYVEREINRGRVM